MENRIYITDQSGYVKAGLAGADEVILAWKGEYAEGDVIHMEFAEPGFYMIRVDDCVDDSLVYITDSASFIRFSTSLTAHCSTDAMCGRAAACPVLCTLCPYSSRCVS